MDIDFVLRSFELPCDRPDWEADLLARLSAGAGRLPPPEAARDTATMLEFGKAQAR